jgi:hypothetical protein
MLVLLTMSEKSLTLLKLEQVLENLETEDIEQEEDHLLFTVEIMSLLLEL